MEEERRRVDPESGDELTFQQTLQQYAKQYSEAEIREYWLYEMKPVPKEYRFARGDRVLCNIGERWLAGKIINTDLEDPDDPEAPYLPYVIKTDAIPGGCESRTISAPVDDNEVIIRERCFQADEAEEELEFTKWAAPITQEKRRLPLAFRVGDPVAIRVEDINVCYEQWVQGHVRQVWAAVPGPEGEGCLLTAAAVPYLVTTERGVDYFCHRDEHTLIRRPENVPRVPGKSISKRFEERSLPGGGLEKFDHATLRGKPVTPIEGAGDDSGDG